jgi:glycosyltransferase involved in cell wall biosynthesis
MRYALVTPARDEETDLPRLAESLAAQTVRPDVWVIVDNGSTDRTVELARALESSEDWVRVLEVPGEAAPQRGAPVVRAFMLGLPVIDSSPDVVVKLDADVSMEPDHFERLLGAFESEPNLGIASGACWELEDGTWRLQRVTRDHARGAVRAYRRECLADVLPLVERVGWDGIDELKARTRGWRVRHLDDLPIWHHRPAGGRHRRVPMWMAQGEMAHYMGYRPSYLVVRSAYRALRDPAALAMTAGYARAMLHRSPRYDDAEVRKLLREEQSFRKVPRRIREAMGRT